MKRFVLSLGAAAASAFVVGCGPNCEPEPDITVSLQKESQEVRALPVLASGGLKLLDTDVMDSHGDAVVSVHPTGVDHVIIDSLSFEQQIDGETRSVERVRTLLEDADFQDADDANNGAKLSFFWRMKELAELGLTEGASAVSKITANWRYAGCRTQSGTATLDVTGPVQGVSTMKNFTLQSAEAGRLVTATGAKAKMVLGSAATNDRVIGISEPSYTVVFYSEGQPPIIGLGLVDKANIALRVGGAAKRQIASNEQIEVYTSTNAAETAPYDNAGQAEATQALVGPGRAVVQLKIDSQRANANSPVTDVVTQLVDVE